jgi:peptidoglycan/LPS O-acetylase OafA/YrhL
MSEHPDRHIGVLDGLRALAILLVLVSHGLQQIWLDMSRPYLPIGPFDLAGFLRTGNIGVDLFFVLSGFLITGQLLDGGIAAKQGRRRLIGRYLKRRFFRIAPAYYLVLAFTTAVFVAFNPSGSYIVQQGHSFVFHLLFLHNFFYVRNYPLFWSLAEEFQFYLLAPFLILMLLRLKPRSQYLALALAIVVLATLRLLAVLHVQPVSQDYDEYFFRIRILLPFSLDGILAGVLCNFLWRDENIRAGLRRPAFCNSLLLGGAGLLCLIAAFHRPPEAGVSLFDKSYLPTIIAACFAAMMLGLLAGSAGQKFFSSRPLRFIALVSYSMYLVHMIVVKFVFDSAARLTHGLHSHFALYFAGLALFVPLTVFLATLMYYLVEKPFIAWARRTSVVKTTPA